MKHRVGRPRRSVRTIRIPRTELLSQHELIVEELVEEDIARGLQLDSPIKLEENGPLNEGK